MPQASSTNPYLILPVSKYSFSLESIRVTKFSWKHIHNAFLIFDSFRSELDLSSTQSSKCLKVVKGGDTLEFVDIESKARQSSAAIERSKVLTSTLKRDQIPTFALHRRNARSIAIRYQVPDNHTRRIQLKFNSFEDFDAALAALAELGLPHYDAIPSNIEGESQMPQQAFTTASIEAQLATSSDGVRDEILNSLPTGHSRVPGIGVDHFNSDLLSPENFFSDPPTSKHPRPSSSLKRPNTAAPATSSTQTQNRRPFTANPTPIPSDRQAKDSQPNVKTPHNRRSEVLRPRTSVSPAPASNGQKEVDIISQHRRPAIPNYTPKDALQSHDSHSSALGPLKSTFDNVVLTSTDKNIISHVETTSAHFHRLQTAPNSQIRNELQEAPPRRELPFQRKSVTLTGKDILKNLNGPDTAFAALSSSNDANMVSISTTSTGKVVDKPPVSSTGRQEPISKAGTVNVISHIDCSRPTGSNNITYEALGDISRNQKPVESQVQEPSERTEQHLQDVTTVDSLRNPIIQTPGCAIGNGSLETPIDQIVDRLMSYVGSSRTDKESLGSYARLSNEERKTIIEGAVIDLIKDDNFAQLCEDLHGTWQRIGLGS